MLIQHQQSRAHRRRAQNHPHKHAKTPREVVRAFERLGWSVARQRGSHVVMTKSGHIATLSIPDHPQVARGTLRALIAKAGLTVEEFVSAVER